MEKQDAQERRSRDCARPGGGGGRMAPRSRTWIVCGLLAIPSACASTQNPIRTALVDITGEARSIEVYPPESSLFPIEDFWWLLQNLRPHEKEHIEQIGLTTQLIQAQDVAYTSDSLARHAATLRSDLTGLDRDGRQTATLEGYWSFVGQYTNAGNLPRIEWRREPFCLVCTPDLPGLADPADRSLQGYFGVQDAPLGPVSFQGWRTISANFTYLRDVPFVFRWRDFAEKYGEDRTMWPSRSCRFCSKNEEPVTIPGWDMTPENGTYKPPH